MHGTGEPRPRANACSGCAHIVVPRARVSGNFRGSPSPGLAEPRSPDHRPHRPLREILALLDGAGEIRRETSIPVGPVPGPIAVGGIDDADGLPDLAVPSPGADAIALPVTGATALTSDNLFVNSTWVVTYNNGNPAKVLRKIDNR